MTAGTDRAFMYCFTCTPLASAGEKNGFIPPRAGVVILAHTFRGANMSKKNLKELCDLLSFYRVELARQGRNFEVKVHLTEETQKRFCDEVCVTFKETREISRICGYDIITDERDFIEMSHKKYF